MSFSEVRGQEPAVTTLTRALASGKVHHAYRFEGPPGVGKRLSAFAFARALLCASPTAANLACEACASCRRARTLREEEPHLPAHPDLLLVERGLYRSVLGSAEASGISIEQVRKIVLSRAGFTPHEGRALVCIVNGAEELTASAANALLKTLEEPASHTFFVLISSRPSRLIDTIRSRTLAVRFGPLPEPVVADLLRERGLDPALAELAEGSMERAVELGDADLRQAREDFVEAFARSLTAPDLAKATSFVEGQSRDRRELSSLLGHLARRFSLRARQIIGSEPNEARKLSQYYELVERTLGELERNVSPPLALEALITRLRRT